MVIAFQANDIEQIMRICGSCVADPKDPRQLLTALKLEIDGGHCTAVGCDGYRMGFITVPCDNADGKTYQMLLKPFKIPGKTTRVVITDEEAAYTLIHFFSQNQLIGMRPAELIEGEYMNWRKVLPAENREVSLQIFFNPAYLAAAAKALSGQDWARLEFGTDIQPVMISGREPGTIMVLPIHPKTIAKE